MKVRKPTESTTTENKDTEKLRIKNQVPADHNISSIQLVKHSQSQLQSECVKHTFIKILCLLLFEIISLMSEETKI